jgi:hypothetical protein
MKKLKLSLSIILVIFFSNGIKAQQYCFWVKNNSHEDFNEFKLRESGSGEPFGEDLLPKDFIKSGDHFQVITENNGVVLWDVQITDMDGSPLLFTYEDAAGQWHRNQRFLTVDAKELHTLVIEENSDGTLSFSYHTDDQLAFGHPCDN